MEKQLDGADEMLMINWGKWGQARDELAEGWEEFREAKIEVAQELADAEAELKKIYPDDELFFIIGSDMLLSFQHQTLEIV